MQRKVVRLFAAFLRSVVENDDLTLRCEDDALDS